MSEQRKYRSWTAKQKIEIVLAGLRGDRTFEARVAAGSATLTYAVAVAMCAEIGASLPSQGRVPLKAARLLAIRRR